jgi:hypothetical protein
MQKLMSIDACQDCVRLAHVEAAMNARRAMSGLSLRRRLRPAPPLSVRLAPLRAGPAHVVKLGPIRIEEAARRGAHEVGDCGDPWADLSRRREQLVPEACNPAASCCACRDDVE